MRRRNRVCETHGDYALSQVCIARGVLFMGAARLLEQLIPGDLAQRQLQFRQLGRAIRR